MVNLVQGNYTLPLGTTWTKPKAMFWKKHLFGKYNIFAILLFEKTNVLKELLFGKYNIFGISLFEKVFGIILGTLCGNWASNLEKL